MRAARAPSRAHRWTTSDSVEADLDRRVARTTHAPRARVGRGFSRADAERRIVATEGGTMGLYKLCTHKGRARDRCKHPWWGNFRGKRVSLARWANREVRSKAEADVVLGELRTAVRTGTFEGGGL